MIAKRKLDDGFMEELKSRNLSPLLEYIQRDNTLDLEIRGNYINIYYRGGNILEVGKNQNGGYKFGFNPNYLKGYPSLSSDRIEKFKEAKDWNNYFPLAKQAMDFYFSDKANEEKEFQQLVVRENNYSTIANGTDYFIIDIEYDNHKGARFDLVAVEWPSKASNRKLQLGFKPKLVIIEMKYGDKALANTAGLKSHCKDLESFLSNQDDIDEFKNEMIEVFKQKRELGLIPCLSAHKNSNEVNEFYDVLGVIFLLSNHDSASTVLQRESELNTSLNIMLAHSSFMGYGLYMDKLSCLK